MCPANESPADDEPALFQLSAGDCDATLNRMFAAHTAAYPIRSAVSAAMLLAEAACQRISLAATRKMDARGQVDWPEFHALPHEIFQQVEDLSGFLFEEISGPQGEAVRLDYVLWDAAGYIHGWYSDSQGRGLSSVGSCAHTVRKLTELIDTLSTCADEWSDMMKRRSDALKLWWMKSLERAELVAQERLDQQSWWKRFTKPTTKERELLSLGFGPGSDGSAPNLIAHGPLS